MAVAMNTLVQIGITSAAFESNSDTWASNAAKLAIEKLLVVHEAELLPKEEAATIFLGDLITQKWEDTSPSDEDDAIGISEDSANLLDGEFDGLAKVQNRSLELKLLEIPVSDAETVDFDWGSRCHQIGNDVRGNSEDSMDLLDGEFNGLAEEDREKTLVNKIFESKSLESSISYKSIVDSDVESSIGLAIQCVNVEDERELNAIIEPDKTRRFEGTEKPKDSSMITHEVDFVGKLDECVIVASHSIIDKLTAVAELQDLAAQTKLLEVPDRLDAPMTCLNASGGTGVVVDVKEIELYPKNRHIMLQSGDTSSSIHNGDSSYLTTSENYTKDVLHRAADEVTAL